MTLISNLLPYLLTGALAVLGILYAPGPRPRMWWGAVMVPVVTHLTAGVMYHGGRLFESEILCLALVAATVPLQLGVLWWMSTDPAARVPKLLRVFLALAAVGDTLLVVAGSYFVYLISLADWSK